MNTTPARTVACQLCDMPFETTNPNTRYCSDACRKRVKRLREKERCAQPLEITRGVGDDGWIDLIGAIFKPERNARNHLYRQEKKANVPRKDPTTTTCLNCLKTVEIRRGVCSCGRALLQRAEGILE